MKMFWLIDAISEALRPKMEAYDVIEYCKAEAKYGTQKAQWMKKQGYFSLNKEENNKRTKGGK